MDFDARLSALEEAARQLAAASWLPGLVTPDYGGSCIANLPEAIVALLAGGSDEPAAHDPRPVVPFPALDTQGSVRRVVLVVLDAFGFRLFQRAVPVVPALRRLAERGVVAPLTSVFPSTTNVALTSLYTGEPPARHGIVGHLLYLREWGAIANLLQFRLVGDRANETLRARGLEPREFCPVATLFEQLSAAGAPSAVITRQAFVGSSLATIHHAGAAVHTYLTSSDLCVTLRRVLESAAEPAPRFVFAYWDLIDSLSHRHGPYSEEVLAEVASVFGALEREVLDALSPEARRETLFLLTADHGHVPLPGDGGVALEEHPALADCLMLPPTGSSRQPFFHAAPGCREALGDYLSRFDEAFLVLDSQEAIERGLFGRGERHPELPYRAGDVLAVARGDACLWRADTPAEIRRFRGIHSGLTAEEMLVPLLAARLDAL
jgi:hypothetical protein